MELLYNIPTGDLTDKDTGEVLCTCYSGIGTSKNNPADQDIKDRGPLPVGSYTLEAPINTKTHGPAVMWLVPDPANIMHGRSGFGMHSDSVHTPGEASLGCIVNTVVSPYVAKQINADHPEWVTTSAFRVWLWAQGCRRLSVVAPVVS